MNQVRETYSSPLRLLLGIGSAVIVIRRTPNILLFVPVAINDRALA